MKMRRMRKWTDTVDDAFVVEEVAKSAEVGYRVQNVGVDGGKKSLFGKCLNLHINLAHDEDDVKKQKTMPIPATPSPQKLKTKRTTSL